MKEKKASEFHFWGCCAQVIGFYIKFTLLSLNIPHPPKHTRVQCPASGVGTSFSYGIGVLEVLLLLCGVNTSYGISETVRETFPYRHSKESKFRACTAPTLMSSWKQAGHEALGGRYRQASSSAFLPAYARSTDAGTAFINCEWFYGSIWST